MKKTPVKLPERVVISNNYVYLTKNVEYHKELKRSTPNRVLIGKLSEDGKMLIPNHNYFEIFEEEIELLDENDRSDTLIVGPSFISDVIVKSNGVKEILNEVFDEKLTKQILDIASYMISSENNVMNYFEDYAYNHILFSDDIFTDSSIDRLFKSIKVKDIDLFIKSWVMVNRRKKIYIAYDSTNMNSVANNIELNEYGHAKDNDDLPQVNLSLGYDRDNGTPLFYELYPGSIIDNNECQKMAERAIHYGCKDIGFILDRGYFSLSNIKYFEDHHYDYIIMTKGNATFIKDVILEYHYLLKDGYSYYLDEYDIYGTTKEIKLFRNSNNHQYVHIFYNGINAENERLNINKRFKRMDDELEVLKTKLIKKKEDVAYYQKYYKLSFDDYGYFKDYKKDEKLFKEMIDNAGFFAIITSSEMNASEALRIYKDRDAVEKVFRMDKSYLGNDVFRVHNDRHLESKVFISFIALIIRNEISKAIKPLYYKNRTEYTVPKVLRQLNRLSLTKLSDNKYHQRYKLTSKQNKILKALNTNDNEYHNYIKQIKHKLNH